MDSFIEMFFIHTRIELRKQEDNLEVLSVDGRFVLPRFRGEREREKKRNFHHR